MGYSHEGRCMMACTEAKHRRRRMLCNGRVVAVSHKTQHPTKLHPCSSNLSTSSFIPPLNPPNSQSQVASSCSHNPISPLTPGTQKVTT